MGKLIEGVIFDYSQEYRKQLKSKEWYKKRAEVLAHYENKCGLGSEYLALFRSVDAGQPDFDLLLARCKDG